MKFDKFRAPLGLAVLAALCIYGCAASRITADANGNSQGDSSAKPPSDTGVETGPSNSVMAMNYNRFGFHLLGSLARQDHGQNVFISPYSICEALAMAYNGAGGSTREAMAATMSLGGLSLQQVNLGAAELRKDLASIDPKIELNVANSLWARQGINFKPDFLSRNRDLFGAEVKSLDFASPGAAGQINQWVSQNTKGKIDKIIDRIDPADVMFIVDAVYFKGAWQAQFDAANTHEDAFHLAAGQTKQVQMMARSGKYQYSQEEGFAVLGLPYGEGRASMYILLPDEGSSLDSLLGKLTAEKWDSLMKSIHSMEVEVKLPRFTLDYKKELSGNLGSLGMGIAFDSERADFSGITADHQVSIQQVQHKARLEVNEEGTVASAATSVGIRATAVMRKTTFFVDHPFFCAIRDSKTGAVLFMGAVYEPQ